MYLFRNRQIEFLNYKKKCINFICSFLHEFLFIYYFIIILLVNDQYDDQEEKPIEHDDETGNLFNESRFVLCFCWR